MSVTEDELRLRELYDDTSVAGWRRPFKIHPTVQRAATLMGAWDIDEADGTTIAIVANREDAAFIAKALEMGLDLVESTRP